MEVSKVVRVAGGGGPEMKSLPHTDETSKQLETQEVKTKQWCLTGSGGQLTGRLSGDSW